jgi:hypothetical protein
MIIVSFKGSIFIFSTIFNCIGYNNYRVDKNNNYEIIEMKDISNYNNRNEEDEKQERFFKHRSGRGMRPPGMEQQCQQS